jgi:succinate-semialdehyde dehydrogenase/glutarate-semialdehyde dehydrogenase
MHLKSVNPSLGETLAVFDEHTDDEIESRLARAAAAFPKWRRTSFSERSRLMMRAAEILEMKKHDFARMMTLEVGKTIRSARDEVSKCAWGCRHYAENAEAYLASEEIETTAKHSYVANQPIGPVLAIMPWNFPFWQVIRFAAPALMAGNVGLLKHAGNVPQCALALESLFEMAGFPEGCFQTLLISSKRVAGVIEDRRVAAVTLTGSEGAGRDVAARAGSNIKKTVLELGGSDPFIVMPSTDFEKAVDTAVKARTINNGQSCIAAKRFIIHESLYDVFVDAFVEKLKLLHIGDPLDDGTDIGPLATREIRKGVEAQVERAVADGARILTGCKSLPGPGNYFEPGAIEGVPRISPVYYEEVFGPVALLFSAPSLDAGIELANDTPFGLGASAWTNDPAEQSRLAEEIVSGLVFFNSMVASDPRLPFGGVKHSGYGRELNRDGILEFVNRKTVYVA